MVESEILININILTQVRNPRDAINTQFKELLFFTLEVELSRPSTKQSCQN